MIRFGDLLTPSENEQVHQVAPLVPTGHVAAEEDGLRRAIPGIFHQFAPDRRFGIFVGVSICPAGKKVSETRPAPCLYCQSVTMRPSASTGTAIAKSRHGDLMVIFHPPLFGQALSLSVTSVQIGRAVISICQPRLFSSARKSSSGIASNQG